MAYKIIVIATLLTIANAGYLGSPVVQYSSAPAVSTAYFNQPLAAVQTAPLAIHAPAIGATQQNVLRSYGGNSAISTYSKAVDTAFSTVRKYDTRITNNALRVAPVAYASPIAHTAPLSYAAASPVLTKTSAISYSPAPVVAHMTFSGFGTRYAW